MQQKQTLSRFALVLIGLGFLVTAGAVALMTMDIPAPLTPIEKSLDAKALLGSK